MVKDLDRYTRGRLDRGVITQLEKLVSPTPQIPLPLAQAQTFPPLFKKFPALQKQIPYINLGTFPTPVFFCGKLAAHEGITGSFYVKDDGQSGKSDGLVQDFGGNKIRKLEFLIADALHNTDKTLLGRGGTGTNFGTAAAIYGEMMGLNTVLVLGDQPNSYTVQRNIKLMAAVGTDIRVAPFGICNLTTLAMEFLRIKKVTGRFPYLLKTGGSNGRGALGFVNAVLELQEQINKGLVKKPRYVHAAVGNGSGGTVAGLLLGLCVAGLDANIVAVHVEPEDRAGEVLDDLKAIFKEANELLHNADPQIPLYEFPASRLMEVKDYCGEDYGLSTKEALDARILLYETHKIELDGTYAGKLLAGSLAFIKRNSLQKEDHVLWNGYCSSKFEKQTANVDTKQLSHALRRYFETPVQELDIKFS